MADKVVLVAGASRGTRRAIALELAAAAYGVDANHASRRAEAERVVDETEARGRDAIVLGADVNDPAAVEAMFQEVDDRFGRLGAFVNDAGIGRRIDILTAIDDDT